MKRDYLEFLIPDKFTKIVIAAGDSAIAKTVKKYDHLQIERRGNWAARTLNFGTNDRINPFIIIILLKEVAKVEVIAHEALHAAYMMLTQIGDKPGVDNEESVAYAIQYIVRQYENYFVTTKPKKG